MQQFVVPQFIDVEDKIFGPITTRQFLIFLVAGLFIFLAFRYGDLGLFLAVLIVVGGFSAILAFVRPGGQAFHYFLLNIIQTLRRPSVRLWHKRYTNAELKFLAAAEPPPATQPAEKKAVRAERIRDLALIVNTGGFYQPEE